MQTVMMQPHHLTGGSASSTLDVRATDTAWGRADGSGYNNAGGQVYTACNTTVEHWTNLLFPVAIPNGATIHSAFLTLYARNTLDWSAAPNHDLGAEQVNNANILAPGDYTTRYNDVATEVVWNPSGGVGTIASGNPIPGADIATVVQEIVNRVGWTSGNNIGLLIAGAATSGCYSAHDHTNASTSLRPRLEVEYTP